MNLRLFLLEYVATTTIDAIENALKKHVFLPLLNFAMFAFVGMRTEKEWTSKQPRLKVEEKCFFDHILQTSMGVSVGTYRYCGTILLLMLCIVY